MKKYVFAAVILFCVLFYAGNVLPSPDVWTQKTSLAGLGRSAAVGFSIGSKGYIGTGVFYHNNLDECGCHISSGGGMICTECYFDSWPLADFWEYDSVNDTWTQKADFGGGVRDYAVGFSISGKGYIGTGEGESSPYARNDFWEYDPVANTWTQKADFGGTSRNAAVGFSIGSKGYIGTGTTADSTGHTVYLKDFWEYDSVNDTWIQKADFGGTSRNAAVGFSIGVKGYIGTGLTVDSNGFAVHLNDFWEYDSVNDGWTQKTNFGGEIRYNAAGLSIGSRGYIGTGFGSSSFLQDFWEYNPASDTWTQKADFGGTERSGAVAFVIGNMGYLGTGVSSAKTKNDLWQYESVDTIPDPFAFTDQTDVALNTIITSNVITLSGIKAAAVISITGGTYSVNGGSYQSMSGTVNNGDTVVVRLTSSGRVSTTTSARLYIGSVSGTFSVTTLASSDGGSESGGGIHCFIATAAFGSPMARQVEILRKFRDRYLLTNKPGQKFVAWYYRNGPVAADYIKDKPLTKAAVRAALYPLIGFSFLLISGYLPFVTSGLLLSALLFLRFRSKTLTTE